MSIRSMSALRLHHHLTARITPACSIIRRISSSVGFHHPPTFIFRMISSGAAFASVTPGGRWALYNRTV
jgi:hypothetical protein